MQDTLTFLQHLAEPGQLVELRALHMPGEARFGGNNQSGFFQDLAELVQEAKRLTAAGARGVYVTLNPVGGGRQLAPCGPARIGEGTTDEQITSRRWLLVDLEARRPKKDEPATAAELNAAKEVLVSLIEERLEQGWPTPMVTMSGNGYHALWRVELANDAQSRELVRDCLIALAERWDGPDAEIDQKVFNAGRIVKLPGTWARKGQNTPERPHRLATVGTLPPEGLSPVSRDLLEALAAQVTAQGTPAPLPAFQGPSMLNESRPGAFDRAKAWIAKRPPAIQGQHGSQHTFGTAAALTRGFLLSIEDALIIFGQWNQTCVPPWQDRKLRGLLEQGYRDGKEPLGGRLAQDSASYRYSPREAASRAQVSESSLRRAIKSGALAAEQVDTKYGPSYAIAETDLRSWMAAQTPVSQDAETPANPCQAPLSDPCQTPVTESGTPRETPPDTPPDRGQTVVKTLQKSSNKKVTWDTSEDVPALLPKIQSTQDIPRMSRLAMEALAAQNERRLHVLKRGDVICRYEVTDTGDPKLRPCITPPMIRGMIARSSTWFKKEKDKEEGGWREAQVKPPKDVCEDVLALDPAKWPFPSITRIVRRPILTPDGQLVAEEGYHEGARVLYKPLPGWNMPEVPEYPTEADIEAASSLILDEALRDFPFVKDENASRAHALAAALQPTARAFISGPTPLWLFDASTPGSGKTLLAEVLLQIGSGCTPAKLSAPRNDNQDEWQKKITSTLMNAPDAILLDNLSKRLDCPPMADVLTSIYWEDRLLGGNKSVRLDNVGQWVATANNLELSDELARRTILCRIDAETARPEERTGFLHSPLKPWVNANLGRLTWATLVLVRAWFVRGCPSWAPPVGQQALGSYESWSHVLGGILQVAGVPGFLANRKAIQDRAGGVEGEWNQFFLFWYGKFGQGTICLKEILPFILSEQLLTGVISTDKERSGSTALGKILPSRVDRIHCGLKLENAGKHRTGVAQYKLRIVDATALTIAQGGEPEAEPIAPTEALF